MRPLLELFRQINGMFIGGAVLLLASGLYMTRALWSPRSPWVVMGMISVLLIAVLGPLLVGRKLSQVRRLAADANGVISQDVRAILSGPALWSSLFALNGIALGMTWLMITKPGWAASIAIPLGLAIVGAVFGTVARGARVARRERRAEGTEHPMTSGPPFAHGPRRS